MANHSSKKLLVLFLHALFMRFVATSWSYDTMPYSMGHPHKRDIAQKVCKQYERRLCNLLELSSFVAEGRHSCTSSWAYSTVLDKIVGAIVTSQDIDCYVTPKKKAMVLPTKLGPKDSPKGYPTYYCHKKRESFRDYDDCNGRGSDYTGQVSRTIKDETCQEWDLYYPNDFKGELGPNDWNFCRNPHGMKKKPWCLLASKKGFDYCNIRCRKYGDFDDCSLTLFSEKFFQGDNCTVKADEGDQYFVYAFQDGPCEDFWKIRSLRISGTFCYIELKSGFYKYGAHNISKMKVYPEYYFVMDLSHDVMLKNSSSDRRFLRFFRTCTMEEVDNAHSFKNFEKNKFGVTSEGYFYAYGIEKTTYTKPAFCCHDPHLTSYEISLIYKEVNIPVFFKAICRYHSRRINVTMRGQGVFYTIPRNICDERDFPSLYSIYSYTPFCIMSFYGKLVNLNSRKLCCCEKYCQPLYADCKSKRECCTDYCVDGKCDYTKYGSSEEMISNVKMSPLTRILIFFLVCFFTSHFIRCCCPERRRASRVVTLHLD